MGFIVHVVFCSLRHLDVVSVEAAYVELYHVVVHQCKEGTVESLPKVYRDDRLSKD